jgi:TM2 domain-containing membrane protein YozV
MYIPGIEGEEMMFLQSLLKDLPENHLQTFATIYNGKRRKTDIIFITTLVGFFGFAGIQRFLINQIGMGILYFFTIGLCLIGTIVDLVNHKKLAYEYNQTAAIEALNMTRMMTGDNINIK